MSKVSKHTHRSHAGKSAGDIHDCNAEKIDATADIDCHLRAMEGALERIYGGVWSSSITTNLNAVVIVRQKGPSPSGLALSALG